LQPVAHQVLVKNGILAPQRLLHFPIPLSPSCNEGHRVLTAAGGVGALNLAAAIAFDLVLPDLITPDLDCR
jgi:CheY-like chemotaxis protein